MIKAIILDVDGVIVGEKIGFNSPQPHTDVLQALKSIRRKDVAVCLCTAKPHYALPEIIKAAELDNPHITDAGAIIIDPIDNTIVEEHVIEKGVASDIVKVLISEHVYTEFYSTDHYFAQKNQLSKITDMHTHILRKEPQIVDDLIAESMKHSILKIMPIAHDTADKERVMKLLSPFIDKASISWGAHPIALPLQFGIITALGSSKKEGAEAIVKSLGITFDEVLGIGDSTSDWNFMQLCNFVRTVANGSDELKKRIQTKGEGKYIIAPFKDVFSIENFIIAIISAFIGYVVFEFMRKML